MHLPNRVHIGKNWVAGKGFVYWWVQDTTTCEYIFENRYTPIANQRFGFEDLCQLFCVLNYVPVVSNQRTDFGVSWIELSDHDRYICGFFWDYIQKLVQIKFPCSEEMFLGRAKWVTSFQVVTSEFFSIRLKVNVLVQIMLNLRYCPYGPLVRILLGCAELCSRYR